MIFRRNKRHSSPQYTRAPDCRNNFIRAHPGIKGFYMCSYCGWVIPERKMQVDHIVSVNLAQKNILYRWVLGKNTNINSMENLTAACKSCNRNKSNKGGLWIIRGKIGPYWQPIKWAILLVLLISICKNLPPILA